MDGTITITPMDWVTITEPMIHLSIQLVCREIGKELNHWIREEISRAFHISIEPGQVQPAGLLFLGMRRILSQIFFYVVQLLRYLVSRASEFDEASYCVKFSIG